MAEGGDEQGEHLQVRQLALGGEGERARWGRAGTPLLSLTDPFSGVTPALLYFSHRGRTWVGIPFRTEAKQGSLQVSLVSRRSPSASVSQSLQQLWLLLNGLRVYVQ